MILKDYNDVLTVSDVAEILKVGRNTAYKLVKDGQIKSHKIGRVYRVPKICMQDFLYSAKYIF